ncbi:MAG: M50 family metallopeptidase [Candidatus Tectomicrobia bacterium]|uniref:M50 family metallopeptidase n=1 Tax=Tectimicrobiota bacterium TaxID=2528274 RepID=A0A932I0H4_UNCTE|nr:M50 family metallopeptidase [Candidatus Tectomicrobia bacterium]
MRKILLRPLAWMGGLLLLPACWALAEALAAAAPGAFLHRGGGEPGFLLSPGGWAFLAGALAYLAWHRLRPPEFLYTFAHEFTHLAFALLMGKKVSRFEVSRADGKVALSGTNFLITLAPYFFPLLAALALAAGALAGRVAGSPWVDRATAFAVGLALSFHLTMTLRVLRSAQPDIARGGRFFSWTVIAFAGGFFAGGTALAAAGGAGAFAAFAWSLPGRLAGAYAWAGRELLAGLGLLLGRGGMFG